MMITTRDLLPIPMVEATAVLASQQKIDGVAILLLVSVLI